jgi:hypothetical protein
LADESQAKTRYLSGARSGSPKHESSITRVYSTIYGNFIERFDGWVGLGRK